ncbi:hypothetical protein SAMN05216360_12740 [Methylobacterium phyllostachyos]|uniref:Pentapeptide MXKDX repeat protein n=1 Tax=Methylobacterium phyllostachyos TaxID=582672 RepID=A0A1H0KJH2_9HYPH|nr:hypothetical protein [Methylobacterium phyllostachyos]SDO56097.1 hypothetical protein SAMN05216360_12740 [Methylobacterium phyllostachyos]
MKKITSALAAVTLLGGLALGAGSASAAPMAISGLQAGQPGITQVRMSSSERMMLKKRMMRKKMMRRHMMKKRMMNRM